MDGGSMRPLFLGTTLLCLALSALSADTGMVIARQETAPAQITKATHSLRDVLQAATLQNRSSKVITGFKVGWMSVNDEGKRTSMSGPWINLPAGITPGTTQQVPAQNVALAKEAREMIFFVTEVKFADGTHWKASRADKKSFGRA
jgi:hypothetical protein